MDVKVDFASEKLEEVGLWYGANSRPAAAADPCLVPSSSAPLYWQRAIHLLTITQQAPLNPTCRIHHKVLERRRPTLDAQHKCL